MATPRTKLYTFVDESGQDTGGSFFTVGVVIVGEERVAVEETLEAIEQRSGKGHLKWTKSRPKARQRYIEELALSLLFEGKLFFESFEETKRYGDLTALATARAILKSAEQIEGEYESTILLDGFLPRELERFRRSINGLHIRTRKVKSVRKEENDAFIRLADAICGLVRDAYEGKRSESELLARLKRRGIVIELR